MVVGSGKVDSILFNKLWWNVLSPNYLRLFREWWGFPDDSDGKESAFSAGDVGSIPGSGRSPGEGNSYPLQYSCLENSMGRGAWQATVHGVAESDMNEWLTLSVHFREWAQLWAVATTLDQQEISCNTRKWVRGRPEILFKFNNFYLTLCLYII